MIRISVILALLTISLSSYASIIEELDNPPEGAHQGQMIIGAFFSIGYPIGSAMDAEKSYLANSTYTFADSNTTKKLLVEHMAFSFGIAFEYILIDHIGINARFRRSMVVQKTYFGPDYNNTTRILFSDYSILLGPTYHVTNRRWWDISCTPLVGYSFGTYKAAPIAANLIGSNTITGRANGFIMGTVINFTAFFTGGFCLTAGIEWTMNMITLDKTFSMTNPQTNVQYPVNSKLTIHSFCFLLSVGYAFSN